jgi:hypothetical protein
MTYLKRWMLSIMVVLALGASYLNAQETTTTLSGAQQSAAKTALCSAIASKFPNPSAAGPSALSNPDVLFDGRFIVRREHACTALQAPPT